MLIDTAPKPLPRVITVVSAMYQATYCTPGRLAGCAIHWAIRPAASQLPCRLWSLFERLMCAVQRSWVR